MGGLLSIFITLLLSQNVSIFNGPTGAWFAALIEEPAKLITVVILVKNKKRYPYILNGLLFAHQWVVVLHLLNQLDML